MKTRAGFIERDLLDREGMKIKVETTDDRLSLAEK
jgi:hypothetical protein